MTCTIINADVFDGLARLEPASVQCCVTSPPYWGLRDYSIPPRVWSDGAKCVFGLEKTPEEYIDHSVEVFSAVRGVLRDDATLWLNIGDSYNHDSKWGGSSTGKNEREGNYNRRRSRGSSGNKPGDLCNIPHRVAEALQADGWYWRSTIVWAKKSPMPESITGWRWMRCRVKVAKRESPTQISKMGRVTPGSQANRDCIGGAWQGGTKWSDCPGCAKCLPNGGYVLRKGKWRPTTAHEYIFLFSKSERYFCDGDAVKELTTGNAHSRGNGLNPKANSNGANNNRDRMPKQNDSFSTACTEVVPTRNPRSVWTLSSEPFTGAHFACFPTKIPLKAIEAGTSKAGCCPSCGSCWAPVVDSARVPTRPGQNTKVKILSGWDTKEGPHGTIHREGRTIEAEYTDLSRDVIGNRDPQRHIAITHVSGYRPTCKCPPTDPVPCLVLDPFAGSGTTGQVANALNRDCVLIEVNPKYVELINERVKKPLTKKRNGNRAAPPGKGQKSFSFG